MIGTKLEKRLLNPTEAAELIGVSRTTIYELLASGELLSVKIGARRFIPTPNVDEYVSRLVRTQNGSAA